MATDQLVVAADVLRAMTEVRRRGRREILEELEGREPDLAEFFLEELSNVHQRVLELSVSAKAERRLFRQVEHLALVCMLSLRQAQARLWQAETESGPLAALREPDDPSLSRLRQGNADSSNASDAGEPPVQPKIIARFD